MEQFVVEFTDNPDLRQYSYIADDSLVHLRLFIDVEDATCWKKIKEDFCKVLYDFAEGKRDTVEFYGIRIPSWIAGRLIKKTTYIQGPLRSLLMDPKHPTKIARQEREERYTQMGYEFLMNKVRITPLETFQKMYMHGMGESYPVMTAEDIPEGCMYPEKMAGYPDGYSIADGEFFMDSMARPAGRPISFNGEKK